MKVIHNEQKFDEAISYIVNNLSYLQAKPIIEALDLAIDDFELEEIENVIKMKKEQIF